MMSETTSRTPHPPSANKWKDIVGHIMAFSLWFGLILQVFLNNKDLKPQPESHDMTNDTFLSTYWHSARKVRG